MPDFKMKLEPLPASPQRLAAAAALKNIAPQKYSEGVKKKDLSQFISHVQKMWRIFLADLREQGLNALNSKKFGYARNCPPVLVKSSVPGSRRRLVPCNLPMCPFCWARKVMRIQEKLEKALKAFSKQEEWEEINLYIGNAVFVDQDFETVSAALDSFVSEKGIYDFSGSVMSRSFWADSVATYHGKISYVSLSSSTHEPPLEKDWGIAKRTEASDANSSFDCVDWQTDYPLPLVEISKLIGKHHAYPEAVFYGSVSERSSRAVNIASLYNALSLSKRRLHRTTGLFFGTARRQKKSLDTNPTRSWRLDVNSKLNALETKLDTLITLLEEQKNDRQYMGG